MNLYQKSLRMAYLGRRLNFKRQKHLSALFRFQRQNIRTSRATTLKICPHTSSITTNDQAPSSLWRWSWRPAWASWIVCDIIDIHNLKSDFRCWDVELEEGVVRYEVAYLLRLRVCEVEIGRKFLSFCWLPHTRASRSNMCLRLQSRHPGSHEEIISKCRTFHVYVTRRGGKDYKVVCKNVLICWC
jgi:hypothetical protein